MPTRKTVKGVKARFRITRRGKLIAFQGGRRHLLTGKRSKLKRTKRGAVTVSAREVRKIRALLP